MTTTAQPRKTPVIIDGHAYNLCGDFGPLVEAEAYYAQRIHGFNLAEVLFSWGETHEKILNGSRKLLPCALRMFHPEVTYDDAQGMMDRAIAADNVDLLWALWKMLPAKTPENQAANQNLRCDPESLAEANEFFEGKPGLSLLCVENVPFTLGHVWRVFPCAAHHFRPELSLERARQLMILGSVRLVLGLLETEWNAASPERRERFTERVASVTSEEDKQEFLFRVIAKRQSPNDSVN
jgi:hypothetical protein